MDTKTKPREPKLHKHSKTHTQRSTHYTTCCYCTCIELLTVSLVSLQSRKASEQAKSVDSKTDSIGSGRAIPIKQVSTALFNRLLTPLPDCSLSFSDVSMSGFRRLNPFLVNVQYLTPVSTNTCGMFG